MNDVTWNALDDLVAGVRASVIRKLDEATDWSAVLTDIYQRGRRESNDVEPQPRSTS